MNKLFSTLALAATFAGSASAYSYSTPGALTPYDMQPTYSLEGLYGIGADDDTPDMSGARLGFSLYNNAEDDIRHQFGVYVAYMTGDITNKYADGKVSLDADVMPVTLGYDLNVVLADNVMLDLGVKAGYAFGNADVKSNYYPTGRKSYYSETDGAFTYSVGAAIKVIASESVQVKLGYEYSRTSFEFAGEDATLGLHVLSLGASVTF